MSETSSLVSAESFPDEILMLVLIGLSKSDLKNTRLVCRRWYAISSKSFIERIYFAPRETAMDDFRRIIFNPILATGVKELVYGSRLFVPRFAEDSVADDSAYRRIFVDALNRVEWYDVDTSEGGAGGDAEPGCWVDPSKLDYDQSVSEYKTLLKQQSEILDSGRHTDLLLEGFSKMRQISEVTITSNFDKWPPQEAGTGEVYETRAAEEFGMSMLPSRMSDAYTFLKYSVSKHFPIVPLTGLLGLFEALASHPIKLKELSMLDTPADITFWGSKHVQSVLKYILPTLKILHLSMCDGESRCLGPVQKSQSEKIVDEFVSKLAVQKVVFKDVHSIKGLYSKNLTDLSVRAGLIDLRTIDMLKAHSLTLKTLRLHFVWPNCRSDESWGIMFSELAQVLRLTHVTLKGPLNENDCDVLPDEYGEVLKVLMQWVPPAQLQIEEKDGIWCALHRGYA